MASFVIKLSGRGTFRRVFVDDSLNPNCAGVSVGASLATVGSSAGLLQLIVEVRPVLMQHWHLAQVAGGAGRVNLTAQANR